MPSSEFITNKVAESGLISFDLLSIRPQGERVEYDLKQNLFQGLLLREKDFRTFIKEYQWEQYQDKYVAIICSNDAIVPQWAYMLLASKLHSYSKKVFFGTLEQMESAIFREAIETMDVSSFKNQRMVIKGCGDKTLPASAYVDIVTKFIPVVKSIMYGEPCSTVPIYKQPI